jgi:hypothetical protein
MEKPKLTTAHQHIDIKQSRQNETEFPNTKQELKITESMIKALTLALSRNNNNLKFKLGTKLVVTAPVAADFWKEQRGKVAATYYQSSYTS